MQKIKPADIVLRVPNFLVRTDYKMEYPAGQYDLYQQIRKNLPTDQNELTRMAAHEYCSIAATMLKMEEDFRIIDAYQRKWWRELRQRLRVSGAIFRRFPKIEFTRLAYPRDLAIYLPNGKTLMCWFKLNYDAMLADGIDIDINLLGEGGRTLVQQDIAMYPDILEIEKDNDLKKLYYYRPNPKPLVEAGLRVGALLPSMTLPMKNGRSCNHLDLYSGLLRDHQDQVHLVTDPKLIVFKPDLSGFMTRQDSRSAWQKVCDQLEITLHFPRSIQVPASICFYQFPSGKVIMTGGDDDMAETVADIVGEENVFLTPTPVHVFPVFKGAGIRCMIGELPPWMRHLRKYYLPTPNSRPEA